MSGPFLFTGAHDRRYVHLSSCEMATGAAFYWDGEGGEDDACLCAVDLAVEKR
jgi:hypothetical protein